MYNIQDFHEFYIQLKKLLTSYKFLVNPLYETDFGFQCRVFNRKEQSLLLHFYKDHSGRIHFDIYDHDNPSFKGFVDDLITKAQTKPILPHAVSPLLKERETQIHTISEPKTNISGLSQYGEDHYFGPLVAAGVYLSDEILDVLMNEGLLSWQYESRYVIHALAEKIKSLCPHSVIVLGNDSFNALYDKMKNVSHMKAWCYAKLAENLIKQVTNTAFITQPSDTSQMTRDFLASKGISMVLSHCTDTLTQQAIQAARVVAYAAFYDEIRRIEAHFNMSLPIENKTECVPKGLAFIEKYGVEKLGKIAKIHYDETQEIRDALSRSNDS